MNGVFKRIPIEKTLFFDIETVRAHNELDPSTKEFELYQKKIRNRDSDELPTEKETQGDYKKRAALKLGYGKIVAIGVGFVRENDVFIKSLVGEEEDILREFFTISSQFEYIASYNGIGYDLPYCYFNAGKYFDFTEIMPDRFITNGKKPWNLDKVVDLMDIAKGTHYANMSLDEVLYFYGLNSSKTDIDGSMVGDVYYSEGIDRISEYVKQDVFATINLFRKFQFKSEYKTFTDRSSIKETPLTPLQKLHSIDYLSDEIKESITKTLSKKKLTKKDKLFVQDLLENVYIKTEMFKADSAEAIEAKKSEITEFIKTL